MPSSEKKYFCLVKENASMQMWIQEVMNIKVTPSQSSHKATYRDRKSYTVLIVLQIMSDLNFILNSVVKEKSEFPVKYKSSNENSAHRRQQADTARPHWSLSVHRVAQLIKNSTHPPALYAFIKAQQRVISAEDSYIKASAPASLTSQVD